MSEGGFQFAGVRVDADGHRLWVDGRDVHCPARVFRLLLLLCAAEGRVRTRDELLAALWSDDEDVADESLTQLVFRLRGLLGRHGDHVATVRNVGVRLAAPVRRLSADELPAATKPAPTPATAEPAPSPAMPLPAATKSEPASAPAPFVQPRHAAKTLARASLVAIVMIAAALLAWHVVDDRQAPDWIDRGHGVRAADLHSAHPQTVAIARSAFQADAEGDRARAVELLQAAHRSDERTPIPALFLSFFAWAAGDMTASDDWFGEGQRRAAGLRDPYIEVLRDYIAAERASDWDGIMRTSGALLDLRPEAWRMRTARAHMLMARGMREAALKEAQAVEVRALDHRKIEMVLADRATLGDVDGALAALARLPQDPDSPSLAFLKARIDYSRGDLAAARAGFARSAELGLAHNRLDLVANGQRMAGLLAMTLGDEAEARTRLSDAMGRLLGWRRRGEAADLGLVVAQMEALRGNIGPARAAIEQVRVLLGPGSASSPYAAMAELFALRLLGSAGDTGLAIAAQPDAYGLRGAPELLAARRHQVGGDSSAAAASLQTALDNGVLDTVFADEARLLADELSIRVSVAERPIDPPYPPLARFATRWAGAARAGNSSTN